MSLAVPLGSLALLGHLVNDAIGDSIDKKQNTLTKVMPYRSSVVKYS